MAEYSALIKFMGAGKNLLNTTTGLGYKPHETGLVLAMMGELLFEGKLPGGIAAFQFYQKEHDLIKKNDIKELKRLRRNKTVHDHDYTEEFDKEMLRLYLQSQTGKRRQLKEMSRDTNLSIDDLFEEIKLLDLSGKIWNFYVNDYLSDS